MVVHHTTHADGSNQRPATNPNHLEELFTLGALMNGLVEERAHQPVFNRWAVITLELGYWRTGCCPQHACHSSDEQSDSYGEPHH